MKKYEFKSGFWQRVSSTRALNSLTQKELAELVGISQRQIAAYESADSYPRPGVLMKLAEALGTTPEWLASGQGESRIKARISPEDTSRKIPIITTEQIFDYIVTIGKLGGLEKWHPTNLELSNLSFALIMEDEAMATKIPLGSIVIFEPTLEAVSGDYVLAAHNSQKAIFRQYLSGMSSGVLSPLDSRYPSDDWGNDNKGILIPAVAIETYLPARDRLSLPPSNAESEINQLT